jgi:hypothetical protein
LLFIFFSLPVGHTHEDIDACFGTIAILFDREIIQTPQEYKDKIEKAFAENKRHGKLKCVVQDVFVVPDYQKVLKGCIDPDFGRVHKMQWTQHQFCFQAVDPSDHFPNGAKFTYRKFSNDRVVVIDKKPTILCKSDVGRKTGSFLFFVIFD